MKNQFLNPQIWLTLLAIFSSLVFLFRGLKIIRWRLFDRLFISLSCIFAALVLFPYASLIRPMQFVASLIVIIAAIVIVADIFSEILLAAKRSLFTGRGFSETLPDYLMEICRAMEILAGSKTGALIVIRGNDKLEDYVSSGISFDAQVKSEVLISLFSETSPVHDGAVVVANGRIRRLKTILSLKTDSEVPMGVGTRHRSALGITEKIDAVALVVSEERGEMSIAYQGCLVRVDSLKELCSLIKRALKGKSIASVKNNS
ncbi:MAG: DNA integrity scanning protein DisA nucleotide-binding domain protein [Candidatus Omnitrophota bacterium]